MTIWMDWRSWTYIVVGRDIASADHILDLDFAKRRLTYKRATGNEYADCPHPFRSDEYERYFHDTVEGEFERVWVDPNGRFILEKDASDSLSALEKPASFIELTDVDPRDYFA